MYRLVSGTVALFAVATMVACSDMSNTTTPFSASAPIAAVGGSGGGGGGTGGGGGGGGGAARPCAILTFGIVNNPTISSSVAPFWQANSYYMGQATGSTEKSCDAVPGAVMTWSDISNLNDGCDLSVPRFVGATYAKYGLKPMSRYDQYFTYYTGSSCVGTVRTIRATLTDITTGTVISTMTTSWTVG